MILCFFRRDSAVRGLEAMVAQLQKELAAERRCNEILAEHLQASQHAAAASTAASKSILAVSEFVTALVMDKK